MAKLIMCVGLPGSGKSYWTSEEMKRDITAVRVNKDSIRGGLAVAGWKWSQENEVKDVIPERDRRIIEALKNGYTVISDDTNLQKVHRMRLAEIAHDCGAEFEVKRFDTPVEECIRRDSQRQGTSRVGEKVIRDMAKRYVSDYSGLKPYVPDAYNRLPKAIVCDLDGTLADNKWRNPYDGSECHLDPIVLPIYDIIETFARQGCSIVYLSGRDGVYRKQTEKFLSKCPPGPLFMRAPGDKRMDWVVKYELFMENVAEKYSVKFVLDDRSQVVQMWRKIGLTCLQVQDGDF